MLPQIEGSYIDRYNVTFSLSECTPTDQGPNCNGLIRVMEPCLLQHSINLCTFTLYPLSNFSVLFEVEPQHVCLAGNNVTELGLMGMFAPFSGCLQHLEILYWNGDVYYLVPDLVNDVHFTWVPQYLPIPSVYVFLPTLTSILNESEQLSQQLQKNQRQLAEHRLLTHIAANKLIDVSHVITQDSNHHWYDFLFSSSTAQKYFSSIFTPVLLIILVLIFLCLCNCWLYYQIRTMYYKLTVSSLSVYADSPQL